MIVQDYFPDDTLNHRGAKIISKKYYMWLIDWSDGVKELQKEASWPGFRPISSEIKLALLFHPRKLSSDVLCKIPVTG
ncbi:MAG TPA: hypothetical protein VIP53_00835 [Nitrososphaera sp.]